MGNENEANVRITAATRSKGTEEERGGEEVRKTARVFMCRTHTVHSRCMIQHHWQIV